MRFRPKQEEIISSILEGKDTLALLPTGGGKSICFQVPAMIQEGVCLVVSPLMSLMYDQVDNLRKRGIEAYAVTSAMRYREIDRVLDNCVYGEAKFLYVSPERLQNELFLTRFKKMNISLIAVDEAHCISQWGYDFRPEYMKIAEIRQYKPDVPVMALTATATTRVIQDIQQKLLFKKENVIGTSFSRPNLSYNVLTTEGKEDKIIEICRKLRGCGIVYCGSRLRTKELASLLTANGISSETYHAGMSAEQRDAAYNKWMRNQVRVICATNAFGMGIDKPDVRFVLHADVPASPESYFQEAGRAGRDGQKAFAVLMYHQGDIEKLERQVTMKFPSKDFIRKVYKCIGNYLQYAPGAGMEIPNAFNLSDFIKKFELPYSETYYALEILQLSGYLHLSEAVFVPSRLIFEVSRNDLYSYQVANESMDGFIKVILRSYTGTFEQYTPIREDKLAIHSKLSVKQVMDKLALLSNHGIIDYQPQSDLPKLILLTGRMDERHLIFPDEAYEGRKKKELERLRAISHYLTKNQCRSVQLIEYFGEKNAQACNQCDVCRESAKHGIHPQEYELIQEKLSSLLKQGGYTVVELTEHFTSIAKEPLLEYVRWKLSSGELKLNEQMKIIAMDKE